MTIAKNNRVIFLGLLVLLLAGQQRSSAQFTNEFTIGEYVEFTLHDTIKIYFNCSGKICRQSCANYYRIGRVDPEQINVIGKFTDYYLNDSVAFEASMDSGFIHGPAAFYYSDGTLKSEGYYQYGRRKGIWKFYYESGNVQQVINYVRGFPFVTTYFNPSGRQLVVNGEGKYIGNYFTYRTCEAFEFKGKVSQGVLDGRIKIYNPMFAGNYGYEFYDEGKFLRGVSGSYSYDDGPKIELPGYNVHENLLLDENTIYCPGFMGTSFLMYNETMYWNFYSALIDSIQKTIRYRVENQWLAIGIGVGYNDELIDVEIYSSKDNYRLEKDLFNLIIDMKDWQAAKIFWRKSNSTLFFSILISEGRVTIPAELIHQQNVY